MLRERSALALLFFPLIAWVIADGSWLYTVSIMGILAMAAYEYGRLFHAGGYRPAIPLLLIGVIAIVLVRAYFGFEADYILFAGIIFVTLTWHVIDFERGAPKSGTDFALTLTGILYVGWIGAFFITIRRMPDGLWWLLLSLMSIWIADSAALLFGRRYGRHKLAPPSESKKNLGGLPCRRWHGDFMRRRYGIALANRGWAARGNKRDVGCDHRRGNWHRSADW